MSDDAHLSTLSTDEEIIVHCVISDAPPASEQQEQVTVNTGFDRLLEIGFSREDVDNLRQRFQVGPLLKECKVNVNRCLGGHKIGEKKRRGWIRITTIHPKRRWEVSWIYLSDSFLVSMAGSLSPSSFSNGGCSAADTRWA